MYAPMIPLVASLTLGIYYDWPQGGFKAEFQEKLLFTYHVLELVEHAETLLKTPIEVAFVAELPFRPPFHADTAILDHEELLRLFEKRVCPKNVDVSFIITPHLMGKWEHNKDITSFTRYTGAASGVGTGRSAIIHYNRTTRNFNDAFLWTMLHELGHLIGFMHLENERGEGICEKILGVTGNWHIMCTKNSSNIFIDQTYLDALKRWQDARTSHTAQCLQ